MSSAFTLDTSGYVEHPRGSDDVSAIYWSDLTPFAQGYVEALFASERPGYDDAGLGGHYVCGFSDLSPEALALILRDCAAFIETAHPPTSPDNDQRRGRAFWRLRQLNRYAGMWPPLTVSLDDDGKVRLAVAS